MAKITYANKVDTKPSTTPKINRVDADDMNEIKVSVNDIYDNDPFNTTETKTTYKYNGKDVYKKTAVINYSDLEFEGNETNLIDYFDSSTQLWIDFSHSFFEYYISNTGDYCKYPLNYIPFNSTDTFTTTRNKTISLSKMSQQDIIIFIGTTRQTELSNYNAKLYLTCEYTKD